MENCFQRDYPLTYTHIDCHGLLRPGALFEIMQDAATQHAELLHISAGDIGALWVLSRLRVQLDRPLRAEETLSLTTWCAGIKGATWLRGFCFQIGGEPVGQAISSWVVLDPVNRRLLRPSAVSASSTAWTALYACPSLLALASILPVVLLRKNPNRAAITEGSRMVPSS